MDAIIQKWGNSLGVRIPNVIVKDYELENGTHVEIVEENGKIIIFPKKKYDLTSLLDKVTKDNIHTEVDPSGPKGIEVW
jgi:antitoxin MazE